MWIISSSKSSDSGCCLAFTWFLANLNLALLIKVLLIKKSVYTLWWRVTDPDILKETNSLFNLWNLNRTPLFVLVFIGLCYFQQILFLTCPSFFVSYLCVISNRFCVISRTIDIKVLSPLFWPTNSYSTGFRGLLVQFRFHCLNFSLKNYDK